MRLFLAHIILMASALMLTCSCADDATFSSSPAYKLQFSCDTISLDTIFSRVPSSTRTMWVHNSNKEGLRCSSIRLANGNQTGFRVNVNGVYLGETQGYQISDEEIRKGDSIRVFVEITSPVNHADTPQLITDDLVFTLESGVQQKVNLRAWSWDAELLRNIIVTSDTVLGSAMPTVIYDTIFVRKGATLTIPAGKTLYMNNSAAIKVEGRLVCNGEPGNEVVLRSDRLDNMFDYLKYDDVSGQWGGIVIASDSYGNVIRHTDIHATRDAIVCDSASTSQKKLTVSASTIHNAKGYGILAQDCDISIDNTQLSNTLGACLAVVNGRTEVNNSTLAQFYPFDGNRGDALTIVQDTTSASRLDFTIRNSIVTGYADDVITLSRTDSTRMAVLFDHCLLRTPEVSDTTICRDIIWEDVTDTIVSGRKNFVNIDTRNLRYDFHLKEGSLAIDAADPLTSLPADRDATPRDDKPDMGCYEKEKEDE